MNTASRMLVTKQDNKWREGPSWIILIVSRFESVVVVVPAPISRRRVYLAEIFMAIVFFDVIRR